jgi:hypothetical protein
MAAPLLPLIWLPQSDPPAPNCDAPGTLLEMRTIAVNHLLLESLKSIAETSFHHVEINPHTNDTYHIAAYTII